MKHHTTVPLILFALLLFFVLCGPCDSSTDNAPVAIKGVSAASGTPSGPAAGQEYYVSPDGDDSNPGSEQQPWRTLQHAADSVQPGQTVYIMNGTYSQGFTLSTSGTSAAPIRFIKHAPAAQATINGADADRDTVFLENADYIIIDGISIHSAVRAAIRLSHSHHVTIRNCKLTDNTRWGIFTDFSDYTTLEGNRVSGSREEHGIYISNSSDNATIVGNTCQNNGGCGIQINADPSMGGDGISSNCTIDANVCSGNGNLGGAAINLASVRNSRITNNVLYNNSAGGIAAWDDGQGTEWGSRNLKIYNNTIYFASGTGRWGISLKNGSTGAEIVNNIIAAGKNGAIEYDGSSIADLQSDYNAFFSADTGAVSTNDDTGSAFTLVQWRGMGYDVHSSWSDPAGLLVDIAGGNAHLVTDSDAMDAGTNVALDHDFEGDGRPVGTGYDIGADEQGERVQVLSPNGGEVWRIGEEHTLRWEVTVPEGETAPETVIVEYSLDGGSTWSMLYEEVPNLGYATAEIPRDVVQPSTQCRFRITDPDSGISDISDNNFTLLPPYAASGASFVKDGVWQTASQGLDGWYTGDFTGDGYVDIMNVTDRHQKVFASDGSQFIKLGSWIQALTGMYGWFPGDFNGDGRTDLLRYRVENRSQVFLSTGEAFVKDYVWAYANPGSEGYTVGDFNGDGKDDMLIYDDAAKESRVYLSSGDSFLSPSVWFSGHSGLDGWYAGDFNGDGLTDVARTHWDFGTQVLLSTGSEFVKQGSWTDALPSSNGWFVGDYNGDGRADLMRYLPDLSGADVFLSDGESFVYDGSWTDDPLKGADWRVGDFSGDGRDDLLRYIVADSRSQVYISTGGAAPKGTAGVSRSGVGGNDLNRGVDTSRPVLDGAAEAELLRPWLERVRKGEEGNFFFEIKAEYEKRLGRKVRDAVIYRMLHRLHAPAARP